MLGNSSWRARLVRARRPLNAVLRTRAVSALVTPHHVDDYLAAIEASWSVREVRARIATVRREHADATSLFLIPNENWRGFRAGQAVLLSVQIDGVRYTRCFSLSSAPEDGPGVRLTIKHLRGGRVGAWAANGARAGEMVQLSQALGDFLLPGPLPPKLLFISGGTGITPIMSMLRHLVAGGYTGEIACLGYARREVIFERELAELSVRTPGLRMASFLTGTRPAASVATNHLTLGQLEAFAPDFFERETFACGPPSMLRAVMDLWQAHGLTHRLHVESFATAPFRTRSEQVSTGFRLVLAASGREIRVRSESSLLEQVEAAGARPAHGCRAGICHMCKCRMLSGSVRNELTGLVSEEPGQYIQLCVTTPRSDVTLEL